MMDNSIKTESSFLLKTCFLLLGILYTPSLVANFSFILNCGINEMTFFVSTSLLLVAYVFICRRDSVLSIIGPIILAFTIVAIACFLSANIWHTWFDSWWYHIPAISHLTSGWNPLYDHNHDIVTWAVHYPKLTWIYSASLYILTDNIFIGTSFNTIVIATTFLLCLDIFKKDKKLNCFLAIVVSLIISFNVVAIVQIFSTYNDGSLGNVLCMLLLVLYAISKRYYSFNSNILLIGIITMLVSCLSTLKFTGALFAFVVMAVYTPLLLAKNVISWNKFTKLSLLVIILSTIVISSNTYIPNFIHHGGNIGYPIIGSGKQDIITTNTPEQLLNEGKFSGFFKSITSHTSSTGFGEYSYALPFSHNPNCFDLTSFGEYPEAIDVIPYADTRVAGFGPYFQAIIWLIFIVVFIGYTRRKHRVYPKESMKAANLVICLFTIFIFITPAIWWARYIPYFYALPCLCLILYKKKRFAFSVTDLLIYCIFILYIMSLILHLDLRVKRCLFYTENTQREIATVDDLDNDRTIYVLPNELGPHIENVALEVFKDYDVTFIQKCTPHVLGEELGFLGVNIVTLVNEEDSMLRNYLMNTNNINDYFEILNNHLDEVIIVISAKDDASFQIHNIDNFFMLTKLYKLQNHESYIGIIDKSREFLFENRDIKPLDYNYLDSIEVRSIGAFKNSTSIIKSNQINFSRCKRGLNICIFNAESFSLIDNFSVDTYLDKSLTIGR